MFKAIGTVIVLIALANYFSSSFSALDSAATQVFNTLETAAALSEAQLTEAI